MTRSVAKMIGNSPLKNTGKKKDEEVGLPKVDYKKLAKGVSNFAQLQSIYGHDRMATRSGQLYRKKLDEAYAQYKQQFPDASKADFTKNAWTTDVKDEENMTPYQKLAREAYEEADAVRQQEENEFRKAQVDNWNSLDRGTQRTRTVLLAKKVLAEGGMIPDNLKKMLQRHQNFGASVEAFTPEEMSDVNSYLERTARHNRGQSKFAAEQLQTLHNAPDKGKGTVKLDDEVDTAAGIANRVNAPLKKIGDSPLKRGATVNFRSLQQAPVQNYATLSQRIGASVDQAMQEQIDRKARARKAEEDMLRQDMIKMQYAEMKTKQVEQFIVPSDTGVSSLDTAIDTASRGLVDQQSALVNQMKAGEIDTDEFAQKSALLKSQVPGIKNFKETMTKNIEAYAGALANGQISNATDPETLAMYRALQNPGSNIQLGVDDNGIVTFTGTFPDPRNPGEEKPFSIPASGIDQMPKITTKVAPPEKTLKPTVTAMLEKYPVWNDAADQEIEAEFDNLVQGNDAVLKSLAMDYFGNVEAGGMDFDGDGNPDILNELTNEDINKLATTYNSEDGRSDLEVIVEDAYKNRAKTYFNAAEYEKKERELEIAKKQADVNRTNQLINAGEQAIIDRQQAQLMQDEQNKLLNEQKGIIRGRIDRASMTPDGLAALGIPAVKKGDFLNIMIKGKEYTIPADEQGARMALRELVAGGYQDPNWGQSPSTSPTKRLSPFKRLTDWFNKLGN